MPWAKIPPENLPNMSLFGYDLIQDHGGYAWYSGPNGRTRVEMAAPRFWFEDVADAQQAGATAILAPDN